MLKINSPAAVFVRPNLLKIELRRVNQKMKTIHAGLEKNRLHAKSSGAESDTKQRQSKATNSGPYVIQEE